MVVDSACGEAAVSLMPEGEAFVVRDGQEHLCALRWSAR